MFVRPMNPQTLVASFKAEEVGYPTSEGTIVFRKDWLPGSSLANRRNRGNAPWKNTHHIVLNDVEEPSFIAEVWEHIVARDWIQPSVQKLYKLNPDGSYSMYDSNKPSVNGPVCTGPLCQVLMHGVVGRPISVGEFARCGFRIIDKKGSWALRDIPFLTSTESGDASHLKTHSIAILKEKRGVPDEIRIQGHVRYYKDEICHIQGKEYYLTKDFFKESFAPLADFFAERNVSLSEIANKLKEEEGSMFNGNLGPIQKIVYGAPGTGKSFGTDDKLTDEHGNAKAVVFRTTFHPDSDYSTFVGAYKPTMKRPQRVVYVNDGKTAQLVDGPDELKYEEKISYEFRAQAFMNAYVAAWKEMAKGANGKPVVLVIEEINRGNCAQIFGDLFQLLDRDDDGYSTYPIDADTDLAKWLASDAKDANNQLIGFGSAGLGLAKPTDAQFKMKLSDWDAVIKGKKLALPPNLYIWATMNTSDQSLFPIDSAFKRRWDWQYVPIREGKYKDGPKAGQKMGWKIKFTVPAHQEGGQQIAAKDYSYDWWEFLKNINAKIFKTTESEDKKLGYFFVKPDGEDAETHDGTISADRFVSKVIFYLWNDVFKDYGIETIFKADDAKKSEDAAKGVEFQSFFNEEDDKADVNTLLKFFKHIGLKSDEENAAAQPAQPQAPTSSQDA